MNLLIALLKKTIGQKIVIALTGLGLCLFVLIHMLGNLLILSGPTAYNRYAHKLHEFPLLVVFELGLLFFFLAHIVLSLLLQIQNRKARGRSSYKMTAVGDKKTSLIDRWLWFQGLVLFVFLIFHLWSFKFGPYYETQLDGEKIRDIYKLVAESFKNPIYTLGYSFCLLVLSVHLLRGLTASLKSLGLSHPVYVSFVQKFSWIFSVLITVGFLAPVWYIFIYK